jgi:hypothetical protein
MKPIEVIELDIIYKPAPLIKDNERVNQLKTDKIVLSSVLILTMLAIGALIVIKTNKNEKESKFN